MKKIKKIIALMTVFLFLFSGCEQVVPPVTTVPGTTGPSMNIQPTTETTDPTEPSSQPTDPTEPTQPDEPLPQIQPVASYTLSFAGDCTLGDNYDAQDIFGTYTKVVKDQYAFPFANVKHIFENDDYTLVNLECALTESDPTEEEMEELKDHRFRFRGPAEYTQILIEGDVEFASCANNHSRDYGMQGLYDTWDALEEAELDYASFGKTCVVTTESGLTIGIFTGFFWMTHAIAESYVKNLKAQGAEIIILSIHWGDEGVYRPNESQVQMARGAIDAGVDIVFGHHSHTLMPVESYNGGIIYYSLGNFTFGGNRNPPDKDTAILQQQILRWPDGSVSLGDLTPIPCRVSSIPNWNNFQPTPFEKDDPAYARALAKLEGSYIGDDGS